MQRLDDHGHSNGAALSTILAVMRQLLLALAVLPLIGAAPAPSAPVVLELFTSQGCSSCPPADLSVAQFADRPDVIALSFAVTYWDHLGWRDTFGRPEFTARQEAYGRTLGGGSYTPEVVAGGRYQSVGNTPAKVAALIGQAKTRPLTTIAAGASGVTLGAGVAPRGGADVWLVRYDPRTLQVPVKAGENTGKTLPVRNVVRQLARVGAWNGQAASYALPAPGAGLRTVVLVQARDGGPILAAAEL
jgi:hypothetical protein